MRHPFESPLLPDPVSLGAGAGRFGDAPDGGRLMAMPIRTMDYPGPLDRLFARHTAITNGRGAGDSTTVHRAILDRLAANRRIAESHGWTACALERVGGTGRLRLWGMPPSAERREVVPDWPAR